VISAFRSSRLKLAVTGIATTVTAISTVIVTVGAVRPADIGMRRHHHVPIGSVPVRVTNGASREVAMTTEAVARMMVVGNSATAIGTRMTVHAHRHVAMTTASVGITTIVTGIRVGIATAMTIVTVTATGTKIIVRSEIMTTNHREEIALPSFKMTEVADRALQVVCHVKINKPGEDIRRVYF
jgi:hypothetical protein